MIHVIESTRKAFDEVRTCGLFDDNPDQTSIVMNRLRPGWSKIEPDENGDGSTYICSPDHERQIKLTPIGVDFTIEFVN